MERNEAEKKNMAEGSGQKPVVLCFDLDDTIWHCSPVLERASEAQHQFLVENFPSVQDVISEPKGFGIWFKQALAEAKQVDKSHDLTYVRQQALTALSNELGLDPSQVVQPAFEAFLRTRCQVEDFIFPDVLDVLKRLQSKGYVLVSLTNGNCDLRHSPQLNEIFVHQVSAECVGAAKPNQKPFLKILELTKAEHPQQVIHIGDSLESDIAGAKGVGMKTVWVNRQGQDVADHGADAVIRCVSEIEPVLEQLLEKLT